LPMTCLFHFEIWYERYLLLHNLGQNRNLTFSIRPQQVA
jgi:hypothetical protein